MSKWKDAVGIAGTLLLLIFGISVVVFGLKHIEVISQVADRLARYSFDLAVPTVLIGLIPGARKLCGNLLVILSVPIGIGVWISGVDAVYYFWGLGPLIIGLLFMGFGPVPMGIVALLLHHHREEAVALIFNLVVVFVVRIVGIPVRRLR